MIQTNDIEKKQAERHSFFSSLLTLWRNSQTRLPKEKARLLADYVQGAFATNPALLRDNSGFNRFVLSLEAVKLAAEEIGLRGDILLAGVLLPTVQVPEQCDLIGKLFGEEVATMLKTFLKMETIEAKTEAMRTDNFRNLLISQAGDMRIILLLIARSVALMRVAKFSDNDEERRKAATEAAYLYAPLAHKLEIGRAHV